MKQLAGETFPLSGNRLIEASAGTGKTHTITNLYLRLLLGHGSAFDHPLAVNQILVLTFTVAATEELRARIRKRIFEARRAFVGGAPAADAFLSYLCETSGDPSRDTRLLTAALQLLDEASIFTIHGFCARVLGDNAFETGTLFDQNLDGDRDVLVQMATEDCFRDTILTQPPMAQAMALNIWPSPQELLSKLKPFLFRFNLAMLPPYRDVGDELDRLVRDIRMAKQMWLEEDAATAMRDAGFRANARCVTWLDAMTAWCASDSLDTDMWEYWTTGYMTSRLKKDGHLPQHPVVEVIERIWSSRPTLEQVRFNLWHEVSGQVKRHLERYKVELAQLTLDDLLVKVYNALEDPGTGEWLAQDLAARWPVAMIDEFQDTDDIQLGIFSNIYRRDGDQGLFFIGDPKQAIYQFRGADVFTYINAKREVDPEDDVYSLSTNWRSTPRLIEAVNTLFDQDDIFDNDADIPFEPAESAGEAGSRQCTEAGDEIAPFTLIEFSGESPPLSKADARTLAMEYAAEETGRLLVQARAGNVRIDGHPLRAGQIAFLVRDKNDARAAREALAARNIRSVYVTLESVFLTETADDLKMILQAVLEPTNDRFLRAALAVPLMQSSASEIAAFSNDVMVQQQVLQEFSEYHRLWATMDVAPMIESLMIRRGIARKWFGKPTGERQITNLRHLSELLQRRAAVAPGMHRLLKWFTREKLAAETVASEERQLRLESDRDLVQIVTMHASKGLEYDVVMIPMAAFVAQERADEPCLFHEVRDGKFTTLLDVSNDAAHRDSAARERLAEDMRLLYVAITRAKYKCYLGIPNTRDLPRSALGRLLQLSSTGSGDAIVQTLERTLPAHLFDIARVDHAGRTRFEPERDMHALARPDAAPTIRDSWRLHSYTGVSKLMRAIEAARRQPADTTPGFGDDDVETHAAGAARINRYSFPRGPRAGVALHTLLEHLDFALPLKDQETAIVHCLDRVGLVQNRPQWARVLYEWMGDVLATALADGFCLGDIDRGRRLDELEFHFPLSTDNRLVELLQESGYLEANASLSTIHLDGIMTGLIDLVFEYDDRFWLVDYKSNHLGDTPQSYAPAKLDEAIRHHQYDLQYLIYGVALNRYLQTRLPAYDYETHFGGVCYLFLRGMQGAGAPASGVFFDRPEKSFVERLDAVLGPAP